MILDEVLPKYDVREYHEIEVKGNLQGVYLAVRSFDFSHACPSRERRLYVRAHQGGE